MIFHSFFIYLLSIFTVEQINSSYQVENLFDRVDETSSIAARQNSNRISASSLVSDGLRVPSQQVSASSLGLVNQQVLPSDSTLSLSLNSFPKELVNLTPDQLLILRNRLINSNNFSQDTNNILLGSTTLYEFCIMCRQLNIHEQPEFLFNPPSQPGLSSSLPSSLQNIRITENYTDPDILLNQEQQIVG